uniref:Ribosomal protein S19 n=1 Tax=Lithodesmium undulatum TaxID=59812 RepID=A0A7T6UZQ0_LITUN|nr:ribosomal protein S19 [Lithodesmium undulatum]QQJ94658.1 ribosomal protein S19 [Lithodesmium undulatum]
MSRSKWKGPYIKKTNLLKNNKNNSKYRTSTILPSFIGHEIYVHNGQNFLKLLVTEDMVGHKFGELTMTRKFFSFKKKK